MSKTILDSLIRSKLSTIDGCGDVEAMPVTWSGNCNGGCNWAVPGFVGESRQVKSCAERMAHYLDFLQAQFNVPDEKKA